MNKHRCPHGHMVGYLPDLYLEPGLLGQIQAKQLVDDYCREGCCSCGGAMVRETDYRAYCSKCGFGIELISPYGEQN